MNVTTTLHCKCDDPVDWKERTPAVVKDGDKLKVLTVKKHYKFSKDEEMVVETPKNNFLPKTPLKRKREDKIENDEYRDPKKMEWIRSKAKSAIIPAETVDVLKPEYLFKETGPLIIYLCNACKKFNSARPMETIEEGMTQIPLAMCTVCRFHHNQPLNLKFFQHELPAVKKEYDL
ncbi:hypothetical protein GCK72_003080 [Caenorhabditis remanei]|uniref:Uncharacterized protein n=1 Tax=Caenorhabditis remanei TaxID=31234 RepID=A0A6A5HWP5_CAERE|nr:hypothetical protein GCK72_003080 [Caenorhabditis remanei]KAF1771254.1 hypothetical protein GCK72_003080 [Caenorhabditis remanei]